MTATRTHRRVAAALKPAALNLDYFSSAQLVANPPSWWQNVLGVVGFDKLPALDGARVPVAASMTPTLGTRDDLCEVWRISDPAVELLNGSMRHSGVRYRFCDDLLFGSITILERHAPPDRAGGNSAALRRATTLAYQEIFAVVEETEHRHLIRVWNYLPEINREVDGDERYRHFNGARREAFRDSGRTAVDTVPAACALGSPAGSPIVIYFLAGRGLPRMIENPRQTSAYHYPPQYGAHSPIFSRACLLSESDGTNLFVSGTASIVGHETVHAGDVAAQTRETLANIDALLDEANRVLGAACYSLGALKFKVYVRQPADLRAIEGALTSVMRPVTPILYLHADICREDLLVEIEATGESGGG